MLLPVIPPDPSVPPPPPSSFWDAAQARAMLPHAAAVCGEVGMQPVLRTMSKDARTRQRRQKCR